MSNANDPVLPKHAHDRIAEMREHKLFTCDLSINEFLLVREAGFDPLGLVMGTSIYQIIPNVPQIPPGQPGVELYEMTKALYHARDLAMSRMEQEADELGADGIVGVRLVVNLDGDPRRIAWKQYRQWQSWAHFSRLSAAHHEPREQLVRELAAGRVGAVAGLLPAGRAGRRSRRRGRGRRARLRMRSARTSPSSSPSARP